MCDTCSPRASWSPVPTPCACRSHQQPWLSHNHTEEATSRSTGYLLHFPGIYRCNSQFRYSQWKLEWYQTYFQFLWQPRQGLRRGREGRELWVPSGWSPHLSALWAGRCWWPPRLSCCLHFSSADALSHVKWFLRAVLSTWSREWWITTEPSELCPSRGLLQPPAPSEAEPCHNPKGTPFPFS